MIKLGVTGGIGSGKTLVTKVFQALKVPVFNSDLEAKRLLDEEDVIRSITEVFGHDVITNGMVARKELAEIVFDSPERLQKLNEIIHPRVATKYKKWLDDHREHSLTVKEAAVLFESGAYKQLDKVINVSAPEAIRIRRVMERDNTDVASVTKRIKSQLEEEERIRLADFTIVNDGVTAVVPQVMKIYHELVSLKAF